MSPDIQPLLAQVPEDVLGICRRLREKGKRGWIVGGCVRDLLRGAPAKDWDVATDARPDDVITMFKKVIPTGIQHGTVTVVQRGVHYEVTTLRGEGAYSDGRRPDKVEFVDDITADLARRDFTINAMAHRSGGRPPHRPLRRPEGSRRRASSAPSASPTSASPRTGCACSAPPASRPRWSSTIDPEDGAGHGLGAVARHVPPRERGARARRVAQGHARAQPSVAFEAMRRTGILGVTCPELLESVGCAQNKWHAYDVWGHAMACLDACRPEPILRVAALLHDVAKPRTRAFSDKTQDYTFYEHERRRRRDGRAHARAPALLQRRAGARSPRSSATTSSATRTTGPTPRCAAGFRRVTPELAPDLYELGFADAHGQGQGRVRGHRQHPAAADAGRGRARQGRGVLRAGPGARRQRADERASASPRAAASGRSLRTWWRWSSTIPSSTRRAGSSTRRGASSPLPQAAPVPRRPRRVYKRPAMSQTFLEQLNTMTVTVADTGDLHSIEKWKPRDATTNPSLITAAAQMPEYRRHRRRRAPLGREEGGRRREQAHRGPRHRPARGRVRPAHPRHRPRPRLHRGRRPPLLRHRGHGRQGPLPHPALRGGRHLARARPHQDRLHVGGHPRRRDPPEGRHPLQPHAALRPAPGRRLRRGRRTGSSPPSSAASSTGTRRHSGRDELPASEDPGVVSVKTHLRLLQEVRLQDRDHGRQLPQPGRDRRARRLRSAHHRARPSSRS